MAIVQGTLGSQQLPREGYAAKQDVKFVEKMKLLLGVKHAVVQAVDNTKVSIQREKYDHAVMADFTYATQTVDAKAAGSNADQQSRLSGLCDEYGYTYTLDGV